MEQSLKQVAKKHGIPYPCFWHRIKIKGLSVSEAVAWGVPPKRRNRYSGAVCMAALECGITKEGVVARMTRFKCTATQAAAMGSSLRSCPHPRLYLPTVLDLTELPDLRPDAWPDPQLAKVRRSRPDGAGEAL